MGKEHFGYFESPLGPIEVCSKEGQISKVGFVSSSKPIKEIPDVIQKAINQLGEYFSGKRTNFDLPLSLEGTEFQKKVWGVLQTIPYGQTITYGDLAKKVGNEKASRAVGGANNKNPVGIIIPCHRVIGANGKLVGYAGGLDKKEYLLDLESKKKQSKLL